MTEAQILEKTYKDKMNVCRGKSYVDEDGESRIKNIVVYENTPCALSSGSMGKPELQDHRRTVDREMTIFAAPDVLLKDMDVVTVITQAGQVFRGRSGRTFSFAGSHGETSFLMEDMA